MFWFNGAWLIFSDLVIVRSTARTRDTTCDVISSMMRDFTNILRAAFTLVDTKSSKRQSSRQSFWGFWDSV